MRSIGYMALRPAGRLHSLSRPLDTRAPVVVSVGFRLDSRSRFDSEEREHKPYSTPAMTVPTTREFVARKNLRRE